MCVYVDTTRKRPPGAEAADLTRKVMNSVHALRSPAPTYIWFMPDASKYVTANRMHGLACKMQRAGPT